MAKLVDSVKSLIEGQNFANIATVMRDGSPQVSPVWIDHEGDLILVNTAEGRLKTNNVKRDPRVALSIQDAANPYRKALIRGKIVETTNKGAEEHIHKMAKKYMGKEKYPLQPGEKRILFKIEAVRVQPPQG